VGEREIEREVTMNNGEYGEYALKCVIQFKNLLFRYKPIRDKYRKESKKLDQKYGTILPTTKETKRENYIKDRAIIEKKYERLLQPYHVAIAKIIKEAYEHDIKQAAVAAAAATTTTTPISSSLAADVAQITKEANELDITEATTTSAAAAAEVEAEATESLLSPLQQLLADDSIIRNGAGQYWMLAMIHDETVSKVIRGEDTRCLRYLIDVSNMYHEDGKGFTLSFTFASNPYFSNTILTKTYRVPNILIDGEPQLVNPTIDGYIPQSTSVDWYPNMSFLHKQERYDQSFFHFFTSLQWPAGNTTLEKIFLTDSEIAHAFRIMIIPLGVHGFIAKVRRFFVCIHIFVYIT
jgi:hypothetical protein